MNRENLSGVFTKSQNPETLYNWYERTIGLIESNLLPVDTSYFSPAKSRALLNFQVEDLAPVITTLAENGVRIEDNLTESDFGKFAWVFDPEGNKIEFWEPRPLFFNPIDTGEPE